MLHIILVIVAVLCMSLTTVIALSGIKFYTINTEIDTAPKDAFKLRVLTLISFAIACVSVCAILIF
jgi:hypothetical protein